MRKFYSFLVALTLIFLSSCKKDNTENSPTKELRLNIVNDPTSLHPQKVKNLQSLLTSRLLFDGLMRTGQDNRPHLALAESYTVSEDEKTYTFILREASWSNGEKIKASDFSEAWKKALDPQFPCNYAFHLFVIKNGQKIKKGELSPEALGAKALDDKTLCIELEESIPYFLELLTFPTFFPSYPGLSEKDLAFNGEASQLVCNGPYKIKQWEQSNKIVFEKNPLFWNEKASHLDQISLFMVDVGAEIQLYEKGDIDWMGSPISTIPLEALSSLMKKDALYKSPFLGTSIVRFNIKNEILNSKKIRKALSLCLDRNQIVTLALNNSQRPTSHFVPSSLFLENVESFSLAKNQEAAKELFEEGLKELNLKKEDIKLSYLYSKSDERNRIIAAILQEQWKENLGIEVKTEGLESKYFFAKLEERQFDIALGSWIADFKDPMNFLENYISKETKTNVTGWEDEEYKELLYSARKESDMLKRSKILLAAENLLLEEAPIVPLFHYNMLYSKNKALKNVVLDDCGVFDVSQAYFENIEAR